MTDHAHCGPFRPVLYAAILALGLLTACGSSETGGTSDTGSGDTGSGDVTPSDDSGSDTEDMGIDPGTLEDTNVPDVEPEVSDDRARPGELCDTDDECTTELCITFDDDTDQGICTSLCNDDPDCPEDFTCSLISNSGGDATRVCVPEDLCIDVDEDGFGLGPGCEGDDCNDEDDRVNVFADELCDGIDNDCDGNIDDNPVDENDACDTGFAGECALGRTTCQGGLLQCIPNGISNLDICNGQDDDCDGMIDEGEDGGVLERTCYTGPAGTRDTGVCVAGFEQCIGGSFTSCTEQTTPTTEVCDGADNDCDGDVDEDVVGGTICTTGLSGRCREGVTSCIEGEVICAPLDEPAPEVCDNNDNDCDGEIDENADGSGALTRVCYTGPDDTRGVGECADGLQTCDAGSFTECSGATFPSEEMCDGLDNNCNGEADEGQPEAGEACEADGMGMCTSGSTICMDGDVVCVAGEGTPELCDLDDNDCDGEFDENADGTGPVSRACYTGPSGTRGVGECSDGTETCAEGAYGSCVDEVVPDDEICNGMDEDCDGMADNGNPGGGEACDTELDGICADGVTVCVSPSLECMQTVFPDDEICDGEDDDCDGETDENMGSTGALTRGCYTGPSGTRGVGECSDGVETCDGGSYGTCLEQTTPVSEVCDGRDNDCNGDEDEGNPGGGVVCDTGQPGVCSAGITQCNSPNLDCVQQVTASGEVCDGDDNDCDGETDENASSTGPLTRSCYTGTSGTAGTGICREGTQTCSGGDYSATCSGQVTPDTEICDGLNNDCDGSGATGTVDEGCPTGITLSGNNTSSSYGGGGGTAFTDTCPGGSVVVGFDLRAADKIDRLRAVCAPLSLSTNTGTTPYTYDVATGGLSYEPIRGGGGGSAYTFRCPSGQAVTGIFGRSGSEVDAIGFRCSNMAVTGSPGSYDVVFSAGTTSTEYADDDGGSDFSFNCGTGQAVYRVAGRAGSRIDAYSVSCTNVNVTQ